MGKRKRRASSKPTRAAWPSNSAATEFAAKSTGWDENRVFFEGDKLDIEVRNGRWVLTHVPAKPRAPEPVRHYFPTE